MKRLLLIATSLVCITMGLAQTPGVEWGPELERPKKTDIGKLIGCDKNSFYNTRNVYSFFGSNGMMLEKYSISTRKLEYVRELRAPEIGGRKLQFEDIFILKGKILVFYSAYFSDQDKNIAYVQKIDAADGSLSGQPKEVDYITAEKKRNRGNFNFTLSDDSSKVLVSNNPPYDKYSNEKFSYKLINEETKELWSASLELPYKDKYFQIGSYQVDRAGDVYMIAKVIKEKENRERKKPSYLFSIIKYSPATKSLKEIPVSLDDKYISDVGFVSTGKGSLALGGFYSNKSEGGLAGTFCMTVDKSSCKVTSSGTKDFTTQFLTEFMSARRAEKHKELYNYSIDHIVAQPNGGMIVVAEQFYINVVTTCNPKGGCTTTYYYNYHDIIVASFGPDANLKWVQHIPKTQVSANDGGYNSSYTFVNTGNKLHFIYNDHPKNLVPERDPKKYKNGIGRKMITVDVAMDITDGSFVKTALFSAKEEKIYTRPKIGMQLSKNTSLFYAIKRRKFKFGVIKY